MKSYSTRIPEAENDAHAFARLEGVDASYKDLAQVCGRIRNKKPDFAVKLLERAAEGEIPILYRKHNKKLGHRKELGGAKGRYPKKAAKIVLGVLKSALANAKVKGISEDSLVVVHSIANKKSIFPRLAPKGRRSRSYLVTSRVEIILKGKAAPKEVKAEHKKKEKESAKDAHVHKENAEEIEKKVEAAVKKEITAKEEEAHMQMEDKKVEGDKIHHTTKVIKPRQQKTTNE